MPEIIFYARRSASPYKYNLCPTSEDWYKKRLQVYRLNPFNLPGLLPRVFQSRVDMSLARLSAQQSFRRYHGCWETAPGSHRLPRCFVLYCCYIWFYYESGIFVNKEADDKPSASSLSPFIHLHIIFIFNFTAFFFQLLPKQQFPCRRLRLSEAR